VEQLSIDDESTWFEQTKTEEGILLKIQRRDHNRLKFLGEFKNESR